MKVMQLKFLCVLLLVVANAFGQEFKLGKVSIKELEEKVHHKDSTAVAAILFRKGTSVLEYDANHGFVMLTTVENRIKIYKKGGYNWANQSVLFHDRSNFKEVVSFSDAVTYNLVGGKIEKVKLKSDGVFDERVNKYRSQKKITMPNVKEGSVIEFSYVIRTPSDQMIRDWSFQTTIPVNYSEFITKVPEYYVFSSRQTGLIFPKTTTAQITKSVAINSKRRSADILTTTAYSANELTYLENQTTYVATDSPAIREEAYVNNIDNYTSTVQHELAMVKFPNQAIKTYSTDWESVVRRIYEDDDFGSELNKTGYFEEDVNKILVGKKSNEEIIAALLSHVKASVKWNNYYGYGCDSGVKKAYNEKTGNIADINLMLTAMLRYAGLTANPVLVSTRSNGIAIFPNRMAFDYVIAAVETPNGQVLLDASDVYSAPNVLPFRALNWFGRLIRKDETSQEVSLMPKKTSNDWVYMSYSIDPEGKITGKTRRNYTDYNAFITRNNFDNLKEEAYLEKLENQNNKIEIQEYSRTNEKEIYLPASESYSFTGKNLCEVIGDKMYINPMLYFFNGKNPFNQEEREYPVDFGFPFTDKYNISIEIPAGFTVEAVPESVTINMLDNIGSFKFHTIQNENTLQVIISHQINESIVATDDYEMLKDYYTKMLAKETEKIVLKRI